MTVLLDITVNEPPAGIAAVVALILVAFVAEVYLNRRR
jgi:hypothetical protein